MYIIGFIYTSPSYSLIVSTNHGGAVAGTEIWAKSWHATCKNSLHLAPAVFDCLNQLNLDGSKVFYSFLSKNLPTRVTVLLFVPQKSGPLQGRPINHLCFFCFFASLAACRLTALDGLPSALLALAYSIKAGVTFPAPLSSRIQGINLLSIG